MPVKKITPDMVGCWLDGAMGWHNTARVIRLAIEYGFTVSADDLAKVEAYDRGEDTGSTPDDVIFLSDQAFDHLQSLAPEGCYFAWDAGDMLLLCEDDS